jgi:hypothetical protein
MAIVLVQSQVSAIDNTVSVPYASPNVAGNCLVVACRYGSTIGTISDSNGNSWTLVQSAGSGAPHETKVWVAPNCLNGSNTVSVTGHASLWVLMEFSGVHHTTPVEVSVAAATVITTTITGDMILMVAAGQTTFAITQSGSLPLIQRGTGTFGGTPQEMDVWGGLQSAPGVYTNTASTNSDIQFLVALQPPSVPVYTQRGNIDYDQIRSSVRQGSGSAFQMFGGGSVMAGHMGVYDASGNMVDGGAPSTVPTFVRETPSGTIDGTNTAFTLSFTPNPIASMTLWLNGVEQVPTTDYTISGATITYAAAPDSVDLMIAGYTH